MILGPEQQELLEKLVEAERRVPRGDRHAFRLLRSIGHPRPSLSHRGWPREDRPYEPDLQILASAGMLHIVHQDQHGFSFVVSPAGHHFYDEVQRQGVEPLVHLDTKVRSFIASDWFSRNYPAAAERWQRAESLLWSADSLEQATSIGHLTREAMVEFADVLVTRLNVEATPDRTKTVARLRAVVDAIRPKVSESVRAMLDALVVYWGTVSDLVQRQEHGAAREQQILLWEDSRRVVFQTAVLFYELHKTCEPLWPVG